jgi:hypothetical protein
LYFGTWSQSGRCIKNSRKNPIIMISAVTTAQNSLGIHRGVL